MSFWNIEERQGDYVTVTVPEYQPSSATLTVGGGTLYKPSVKSENVSVGRVGIDAGTIVLVAIPVGIFLIWMWIRRK